MSVLSKRKSLIKKTMAIILGLTMTFGTLMLPECSINDEIMTVSAESITYNGSKFEYKVELVRGKTINITSVTSHGETVEIPSSVTYQGVEYPVTKIGSNFLKNDTTVKTVIFPETVTYIGENVLSGSSVENIRLPNGLEHLERRFACDCMELSSVEYEGTSIKADEIGRDIFSGANEDGLRSSGLLDDNDILCLGNCLLKVPNDLEMPVLRIADLGNGNGTVNNIAPWATYNLREIQTVDLEGVKYISLGNFQSCFKLKTVLNSENVERADNNTFHDTPWYEKSFEGNLIKLGKVIIYYKTDSDVLDLTSGEFKDTKYVCEKALKDCENLNTILCNSDCIFMNECFYRVYTGNSTTTFNTDDLPLISTYDIKNVYVDGKPLTYNLLLNDQNVYEWFHKSFSAFKCSEITKKIMIQKTRKLFDQMDLPYYGMNCDEKPAYTPREEFYIRLKIHEYMSTYNYDVTSQYVGLTDAFLLGGNVTCTEYATLTHYLLECAGMEAKTLYCDPESNLIFGVHYWNSTRIGDEWFEGDDGWDSQYSHTYGWFGLSSLKILQGDPTFHRYMIAYNSFHLYPSERETVERVYAERIIGDIDADNDRDDTDVNMLWDYVKGSSDTIDQKLADVNFDGTIDVTDAVLLDNFTNGKSLDVDNIPIDGLAPTVKIAFLNGEDYDNIKYLFTDREGYIELPDELFEAPEGKKLSYDIGKVGQKVRITEPYTIVRTKWIDAFEPDSSAPESSIPDSGEVSSESESSIPTSVAVSSVSESSKQTSSAPDDSSRPDKTNGILGDVNNDRIIDIEDAVAIIQHINGMTPLKADEEKRADVSKDNSIDIDDAVTLISYINGNSTF